MQTRLQEKCPDCGKVAKEKFSLTTFNRDGNEVRIITLECFHIITKIIPRATPFEGMVSNDWMESVKNCKHDWDKHQCRLCGEFKLMPFQVEGAKFIESALSMQKGVGVFDDMGLGKTVQGLAYVKYHFKTCSPTLYIVKSKIKFKFFKEIIRWLGPDFLGQIISTGRDSLLPGLKTYIISFDLLRRFPREKLEKLGIKLAIIDECQQIKNPDSSRTREVRALVCNPTCKVIALSGTPWKNKGSEFFPILNILDPIKFHSYQHFLDHHVDFYYKGNQRKQGGIKNPKKFREYINNIVIRREFDEVIENFPNVNRTKLIFQLDEMNQSTYNEATSDFVKWYNDAVIGGEEDALNGMEILAKLSRMRHIVGLAKIPATLGYLEEFVENTDKKIVVFIHHIDVGVLMYQALTNTDSKSNPDWHDLAKDIKEQGIEVMQMTSALTDEIAFSMNERFNGPRRCIMIASTLSAGEGLDFQTACDGIMHERQWNPQNEMQALPGRFKRIGQLSSVINSIYAEAEGTVDEFFDELVEGKRRNFHAVMNKSEEPSWSEGDLGRDLAKSIVAKFNSKNPTKTNAASIIEKKSLTAQLNF